MTKTDEYCTWRLAVGRMDCEWCRAHKSVQVVPHHYGALPPLIVVLACRAYGQSSEGEDLELSDDKRWKVEDDAL